jgi:hypothetical protein
VVNAAFNYAIAIQRSAAVLRILSPGHCWPNGAASDRETMALSAVSLGQRRHEEKGFPGRPSGRSRIKTIKTLLKLANQELKDAIVDLQRSPLGILNQVPVRRARKARALNELAIRTKNVAQLRWLVRQSLRKQKKAKEALGTGLDFVMGEANLLF